MEFNAETLREVKAPLERSDREERTISWLFVEIALGLSRFGRWLRRRRSNEAWNSLKFDA